MSDPASLLVVPLLMIAAALAGRATARWIAVPIVVFELVLGVAAGPDALGWVDRTSFLAQLSQFGVMLLFFVAGSEIDAASLRGRTGRRAWLGWAISICIGVAIGYVAEPGIGALIIGICLASTALGTLLPILRDAGDLGTPFGSAVGAVGTVGEFGPIIAISVFLGTRSPGMSTVVLVVFAVIALAAILHAQRRTHQRLHRIVESTLHTSGQFAVRCVLGILAVLVFLALQLGVDMLLGAFTAGIVWRLLMRDADEATRRSVDAKVDALAFGFLVPIFFVYTGVKFDLRALLDAPLAFAVIPVVTIALLLVRGIPSMLAAPTGAARRERAAVGLMGATALPIIVVATDIGVEHHAITSTEAAVFVGAGVLSVLVFPIVAAAVRKPRASV
ncbi:MULTISPECIES: cation:proton antiporter [unclassified Gordonia (in: high G+C Gram-positive bacteria)]|uniref:cation:proton antiporter n=1 Tax=unclassified Gordonia (in: high G+C Gram-positive bacteria) TaxID=2657482 RepID=UPI001F070648|nr:cation:proton antiporter [Gordonia sp. PDNC005]